MNQLFTDLRSGIRMLVTYPTLSIVAVVTLGLGIGLSTTVFCVVNGGLFKGLPFPDAPRDAAVFVAVTVTLALASLIASVVPARRVTKIDPMLALASE